MFSGILLLIYIIKTYIQKHGSLYGLECPLKKEIVYIGQTHNELNVLIKLNVDNQIKIILIEKCDVSIIDEKEIYWINKFSKTTDLKNLASGGRVNRGFKLSENCKKKISENRKEKCCGIENPNYKKVYIIDEKLNISNKLKDYYKNNNGTFLNKKHSEETKRKISKSRSGKYKGKDHPFYGKERSIETRKKISKATKGKNIGRVHSIETKRKISISNSGDKNGMYGKHIKKSPEQIEKQRINMINSKKFQESRKSDEFRNKISNAFSIPICILDENLKVLMEFKNTIKCSEYLGCSKSNVKNAVRDIRKIMKKYWVVRKENLEDSIEKIKNKS